MNTNIGSNAIKVIGLIGCFFLLGANHSCVSDADIQKMADEHKKCDATKPVILANKIALLSVWTPDRYNSSEGWGYCERLYVSPCTEIDWDTGEKFSRHLHTQAPCGARP